MLKALLLLAGFMTMALPAPDAAQTDAMLRLHVVAHDDTEDMQRVKRHVRDALLACPAAADAALPIDARAAVIREAAEAAAREAGFTGGVRVVHGVFAFPRGRSGVLSLGAGDYPAVLVLLGDAQGSNWWGLIDPAGAMAAACPLWRGADAFTWDWSWQGFIEALLGWASPDRKGA